MKLENWSSISIEDWKSTEDCFKNAGYYSLRNWKVLEIEWKGTATGICTGLNSLERLTLSPLETKPAIKAHWFSIRQNSACSSF